MASSSRDRGHLSLPANGGRRSDGIGQVYTERQTSIPIPPSNPGNPPTSSSGSPPAPNPGSQTATTPAPANPPPSPPKPPSVDPPTPTGPPVHHRFLTPTEWARVAHGIGAIREGEQHQVVHPTCWYWPPKGLPDGLYRDVVTQRFKYSIGFHFLSTLHWFLVILQVTIGAVLTALGSLPRREPTPITSLAAVNTVSAGLLGLLHNSGLPDRYRMDKAQFSHAEDFIKELLDTGIVEVGQTVEDVLNECYVRFQNAKATVLSNKPEVYSGPAGNGQDKTIICPEPSVHVQLVGRR